MFCSYPVVWLPILFFSSSQLSQSKKNEKKRLEFNSMQGRLDFVPFPPLVRSKCQHEDDTRMEGKEEGLGGDPNGCTYIMPPRDNSADYRENKRA